MDRKSPFFRNKWYIFWLFTAPNSPLSGKDPMMVLLRKFRSLLPFVFITLSACGNAGKTSSDGSIRGPVVTGSKNSGAYITLVTSTGVER